MGNVRIFTMLIVCAAIAACSGGKKSSAASGDNITKAEVAGYYIGMDEFEKWSCELLEDGTGYELASYSTGCILIAMPLIWSLEDGKIIFTFLPDDASVEGDTESDLAQAIVSSAMAGYSEPRTCSVLKEGDKVVIDGEGLYPTFEQLGTE